MLAVYSNNLLAAVYLWAENRILQSAQAYQTVTTRLYPTADPQLGTGWVSYSAPFKQFVYDSGISGAYIINEASGGAFTTYPLTRASGMHVDYENGRVLLPAASGFGSNLVLTGTYSVKEVNIYTANESEETLLTQGKYFVNPRYNGTPTSGVPPYAMATPAVFINLLASKNEAYQLGGLVDSRDTVTMTVLAETSFQLNGVLSIFRDARYGYIPMLNTVNDPLDAWGDVKGGTGYNYQAYVGRFGSPGNLIYITDVRTAKVSDRLRLTPTQFAGIVDLDLSYIRQPPVTSNLFV